MTKTTRTLIDIGDLTGLHLECEHCRSTFTIPFQKMDRGVPRLCPNCNEDWGKVIPGGERVPQQSITDFGAAIRDLLQTASAKTGVKISVEVSGLSSPLEG